MLPTRFHTSIALILILRLSAAVFVPRQVLIPSFLCSQPLCYGICPNSHGQIETRGPSLLQQ